MSVPALRAALADEVRAVLDEVVAETAEWREWREQGERIVPAAHAAILKAVRKGAPQRAVADAVGASHALPGQIIAKAKRQAKQRADNHEAKEL